MCKQQPAGTACRRDVHPDNGRQQWGTAAHGVVVPCRDHCVSVKEENQLPRGLCEPGIQRRPAEVFRRGTIPQPHNHNHHNHNHHNQHSKHSQPAQPASTVWCQVSMATQFVPRSAHQSDTPEPMVTRRAFFFLLLFSLHFWAVGPQPHAGKRARTTHPRPRSPVGGTTMTLSGTDVSNGTRVLANSRITLCQPKKQNTKRTPNSAGRLGAESHHRAKNQPPSSQGPGRVLFAVRWASSCELASSFKLGESGLGLWLTLVRAL